MTEFRTLRAEELTPELFREFRRYQQITRCWRKTEGQWRIVSAPRTIDNWTQEQREFVCRCLSGILEEGGLVAGGFCQGVLKAIVAVEGTPIGSEGQYLPVAFLHVSQELRGKGMGKTLFSMAKAFAAEKSVSRLYISSQASVETQAFYRAMGCVEAEEYNEAYVAHNPEECQLECSCQK